MAVGLGGGASPTLALPPIASLILGGILILSTILVSDMRPVASPDVVYDVPPVSRVSRMGPIFPLMCKGWEREKQSEMSRGVVYRNNGPLAVTYSIRRLGGTNLKHFVLLWPCIDRSLIY